MIKKTLTIIAVTLLFSTIWAQSPQRMSYQAVIRNSLDLLVTNHAIGIRVSILQGSETGTPVYVETQTTTSNSNGLVTIEIGGGTPVTGTFAAIDWSAGTYFIKTETDPAGGTDYTITGTSQILSVPYALFANNLNLRINSRPSDIFVKNEGSLWIMPKISVEKPYSVVPTVTDASGNIYTTVKIGTQIWITENLKTTLYNDNSPIPLVVDNNAWTLLTTSAYCWLNNDITNKNTYGALYNWYAVNTNKLCPIGWHVPTHSEFEILTTYLGSLSALRLCESGTIHWQSYTNTDVINDSKFTAIPGGYRDSYSGSFSGFSGEISEHCFIWSSTENASYPELLYLEHEDFELTSDIKQTGSSVRCIKD